MLVTSEVSKHLTMFLFEAFSDSLSSLFALVNTTLIPRHSVVGEDVVGEVVGEDVMGEVVGEVVGEDVVGEDVVGEDVVGEDVGQPILQVILQNFFTSESSHSVRISSAVFLLRSQIQPFSFPLE